MADDKKAPKWAWWLLVVVSMAIIATGMAMWHGSSSHLEKITVLHYAVSPGNTQEVKIPPANQWRITEPTNANIVVKTWSGKKLGSGSDKGWRGEIQDNNFTIKNNDVRLVDVTVAYQEI